jgi:predicted alpha-1,2-mannosidase
MKILKLLTVLTGLFLCPQSFVFAATPLSAVDYVDPMVGSAAHGHTFPGAVVPFGLVSVSPDTRLTTWDGCSGYHYDDPAILGFSHTHLSGTGGAGLGDVMLMPTVGPIHLDAGANGTGYASRFSHSTEVATPGYYKVFLQDPGVTAELTATARTGFHRYTFPASNASNIVLDLAHGIGSTTTDSGVTVENSTTISGYRISNGWGGTREVYFVMQFSRPFDSDGIQQNGNMLPVGTTSVSGGIVKAYVTYTTKANEAILVKVGISGTSIDGARKNLTAENPGWDFDAVREAARAKWVDILSPVQAECTNPHILRTFYSNLYLAYLEPTVYSDVDGTYMGMDHKVHPSPGFTDYTTFSIWDCYRAEDPMLNILQPGMVNDMINTYLTQYQQLGQHTVPIWPLWDNETWCMIGYHSADIIIDAYLKGYRGYDVNLAYQAILDTATQNRNGLDTYKSLGYVASTPGACATSKTIEYSYDDWCIAKMAESLGHTDDAKMFYARSANYYNLFDKTTDFFRGRKANGSWRTPFDTLGLVGDEYTEADAWQYAFGPQQDIPGLIALYGGNNAFTDRLDQMFNMSSTVHSTVPDISGLIGQYSQGDEQSHHVAYLYDYAGVPYKTQMHIRQVMQEEYQDTPDGECGNTDCGQMTAWYVFSAMGFYPVNPDSGVYMIGSPVLSKVVLHLDSKKYHGHTFTVIARNNSDSNVYIQSATWNGKPYNYDYITYNQISSGGTLAFVMGPKPNLNWAASPASSPAATMPANFVYPAVPPPASTSYTKLVVPIHVVLGSADPVGNFVPDPNNYDGSMASDTPVIDISAANAAPVGVYQSERYGSDMTFTYPVPAGRTYTVRLHFAEIFDSVLGQRVENIALNGTTVLPNFEILKDAGAMNKAVVKSFTGIQPDSKGNITIRISATPDSPDQNAKISGIEILPE